MEQNLNKPDPEKRKELPTKMIHLMSFPASRGDEWQLHDAEYRGQHFFDYRRYESRTRGKVATPKGVRLSRYGVEHLKDAICKWEEFYKRTVLQKEFQNYEEGEARIDEKNHESQ